MAKTKNIKSAGPERVIYCGPNLGNGALLQSTIYKQGLPDHLTALFDSCPEIKELFVPVQDFIKVQAETNQPGTYFYRLYQIVQAFIREEQSK